MGIKNPRYRQIVSGGQLNKFLIFRAEDYIYSSAIDYAGEKGLLDNVVICK
jgi:hypothetical protein